MENIRQFLNPLLETLGKYFPSVFGALLIFIVGIGVARLLRKGLAGLLSKLKIDQKLYEKTGNTLNFETFITNLIYYILLLWVLLLTLDVLGVKGVLDPVMNMFAELVAILPNIVAAVLIGFVGYVIAKIVSSAVGVLSKGLDTLSPKIGLSKEFKFSNLLEQIVFLVIFVPILISALDALKIEVISVPSTEMLAALLASIPKILAAALIVGIAFIVGRFATNVLTELLENLGADAIPERIGVAGTFGDKTSFSKLAGGLVFFFIMLAATISAVEKLQMPQLSNLLSDFMVFAGQIALGLIILAIGNFIANLAYKALLQSAEEKILASIVRIAILGLVIAMGLGAMGIAQDVVNLAFGLTLGAIAISVALSFGLGGREAAGRQMEYWLSKFRKEDKK
ncbi:MAG: mechanosensitive ion channel [Desulfobulbaceae bacterium]|nr:mechanosensitive ion channel [Desulfobulbaceae bacterium]